MTINILEDQIFSTDTGQRKNLPELISELHTEKVRDLSGLPAHQKMPVFTYLCQIASMIATKYMADLDSPSSVRSGLMELSGGNEYFWHLVSPEDQKGFMQFPVPEQVKPFAKKYYAPEHIDMLLVTKEHSIKSSRAGGTEYEGWAYSLICAQTASTYAGNGLYGTIKRSHAFSTRPFIGMMPVEGKDFRTHFGKWFKQDVSGIMRKRRSNDPAMIRKYKQPGLAMSFDWDGEKGPVCLSDLDPHFVDMSRIIKMHVSETGELYARIAPTKGGFVSLAPAASEQGEESEEDEIRGLTELDDFENIEDDGDEGCIPSDPWTPLTIRKDKGGKAYKEVFNLGDRRLDYRMILSLFDGNHELPFLMKDSMDMMEGQAFYVDFMGRSKGKSEGRHTRLVHLPSDVLENIWQKKESLHVKAMIESIDTCEVISRKSILLFLARGDDATYRNKEFRKRHRQVINEILNRINQDVDRIFFKHLITISRSESKEAEKQNIHAFKKAVKTIVERHTLRFINCRPVSSTMRVKSDGIATDYLYQHLQHFLPEPHKRTDRASLLAETVEGISDRISYLPQNELKALKTMRHNRIPDTVYKWKAEFPDTIGAEFDKWCDIIRIITLIYLIDRDNDKVHNEKIPLGRFLVDCGQHYYTDPLPVVSEKRFNRMVRAPYPRRVKDLENSVSIIRNRISRNCYVDLRDIAWFLLDRGRGNSHRRLSQTYYNALYHLGLRHRAVKNKAA